MSENGVSEPNAPVENTENEQKMSDKINLKSKQNLKNLPSREYLDKTVIPIVLKGMVELVKARPENPILYLAEFLNNHAEEN